MPEKPYIRTCRECSVQFYSSSSTVQYCSLCKSVKEKRGVYGRTFYKNKLVVLERDDNKCQCCGTSGDEKRTNKLIVHHLDCDTRNNSPSNLITLCNQCHSSLHKKYSRYVLRRSNIYKLFANEVRFGEFGKNLIYGASKQIVKKQFTGKPKLFFKSKKKLKVKK
jgi:hypothetical protein